MEPDETFNRSKKMNSYRTYLQPKNIYTYSNYQNVIITPRYLRVGEHHLDRKIEKLELEHLRTHPEKRYTMSALPHLFSFQRKRGRVLFPFEEM